MMGSSREVQSQAPARLTATKAKDPLLRPRKSREGHSHTSKPTKAQLRRGDKKIAFENFRAR
jgi:hypothetical protein